MKKHAILALTAILTASLLAGCRNPNMDMDTNPGNTVTPTGSTTDTTADRRETQPHTTAPTSVPTTLPQTDTTAESSVPGTEATGSNAGMDSRFRRRAPGM